jgi:hypothetical protein
MARDGEINLSYVPSTEMLTDCFTKPLLKPTILKLCAAIVMIAIGLGIGHRNGLMIGIGNDHGNGLGTVFGNNIEIPTGKGIGNADGGQIDPLGTLVSRRSTLFDWLLCYLVYYFV